MAETTPGSMSMEQGSQTGPMAAETIADAEDLAIAQLPPTDGQSAAIMKGLK